MRSLITKLTLIVCLLAGFLPAMCNGQVTLAWNPSPDPTVTGYYLCWGTSSGVYTFTNNYTSTETSCTVSNLVADEVYFFAVQAFANNGTVSPFSNEVSATNEPPSTNSESSTNTAPIFVAST
ncbi:MAG TPA: fibronectin type III domain-containing protein, partial [Candidatus Saccharimonadales bacterium]|nr:fibronectin type III domain-containing protein [Candidatus Saccharimonadales bacterium]